MKVKELAKFDNDDLIRLRELFNVMQSANYELKGDAIEKVGSLYSWYRSLETKISAALKKQAFEEAVKKSPKTGKLKDKNNG